MVWVIVVLVLLGVPLGAWWAVTQPGVDVREAAPPEVSAARLEADVRRMALELSPRSEEHVTNLQAVSDFIAQAFREAGGRVSERTYEDSSGVTRRNVIAQFGPEGGEGEAPEVIVLGAHYDAFGPHPGADDNASGVAGLLELARLFGAHPPPMPVELVAYPNEEPPHFTSEDMGSDRHAAALEAEGRKVRAMFSLEMLGYFSDEPGSQGFPIGLLGHVYPDTGNYIVVVGRFTDIPLVRTVKGAMLGATDLPVESINAPTVVPGVDFSDHRSYWARGMPAVMVTDTAFYRNPNYHTPHDTPDTLDYARMAKVVQGVYAAVLAVAQER